MRGEQLLAGFIRDVTDRKRQQDEREALVREQAARAEAERVAELVSGMQLLVDAALAHRTLDEILSDLVTRVRAVLDADAAAIYLAADQALTLAAASGGEEPERAEQPLPFGEGFAGRVASEREPMLVQDPPTGELPYAGLRALEIDSLIGLPLLAEGEVTGVLVVGAAAPRHFTADDVNLLRLAADRVALAIDHARVYEREHRIAETLQRSLLPERLPQLPGLSVAARYLPAAVGGRGRGRLVRRAADPERRRRPRDGRRGRQGPGGGLDGRPAAQRAARLRAGGPRAGRAWSSSSTG